MNDVTPQEPSRVQRMRAAVARAGRTLYRYGRRFAVTIGIVVAVLTVAIPSAGHGYTGAFTTPVRLIAALVPLLALFLADAAQTFRASRWVTGVMILAGVVSIQNGLTYNSHFIKSQSFMQAATVGGWLSPLLLPDFEAAHRLRQPLTTVWIAATIGLAVLPFFAGRKARGDERPISNPLHAAAIIAAFGVAGSLAIALGGPSFSPQFALRPGDARDQLIHRALADESTVAWSSRRGRVDLRTLFLNPEGTDAALLLTPPRPVANRPAELSVAVTRPGRRPGWGTAVIDFGDGTTQYRAAVEGTGTASHVFERAGEYTIRVHLDAWGLPERTLTLLTHVDAP